jgi:hypothetical protein
LPYKDKREEIFSIGRKVKKDFPQKNLPPNRRKRFLMRLRLKIKSRSPQKVNPSIPILQVCLFPEDGG